MGCGGVGWVAHVIIVSAQVLLVLTLGLWNFGLGLVSNSYFLAELEKCSGYAIDTIFGKIFSRMKLIEYNLKYFMVRIANFSIQRHFCA